MKFSRDGWLALGVLLLLVVVTVAATLREGAAASIPYLSSSSAPGGMLALKTWLGELGYRVVDQPAAVYEPPESVDIIFLVEPLLRVNETELKTLNDWVDAGGTLVVAGDSPLTNLVFESYGFRRVLLNRTAPPLAAQNPLLDSPPLTGPAPVAAVSSLGSERTDFVALLADEGRPVVVSFAQGRGRVILASAAYPFSNHGLKEHGNARLTLNLVSLAVRRGAVWFDDWHHGVQGTVVIGPEQWLRRTPAGHALVFVTLAVFAGLILQGRAFGRAVPLHHEIRRRGPLEHVTAVANLNRKAGHRSEVLGQYRQQLKRHLGRRYRLDPSMPDEDYVRQIGSYNASIDQGKLLGLLRQLSHTNVSEADLVSLAGEASKWMKDR